MDSEQGKRWWFSLKYHTVEDDDGPTPGKDRLGPYPDPGSGRPRAGNGAAEKRGMGRAGLVREKYRLVA